MYYIYMNVLCSLSDITHCNKIEICLQHIYIIFFLIPTSTT